MTEVDVLPNYLENWSAIKNDFIYVDQKMDVTKGLYDQYLDPKLEDYNIHKENKNYVMTLFDEYKELKKQIEEAIYSPQDDEELICLNTQKLYIEEKEALTKHIIRAEAELNKLGEKSAQIKKLKENQRCLKEEEYKNKVISIQTENVMEKYKMFAKINLNQTQLINSLIQSNDRNSTDTVLLNKYYTHEILTGIQIIERLPYENREMFEQLNAEKPWYDIVFNTLPDSCMDFDSNSENYPEQLKKNMSHLSNSCVEFYKSIFRKRKTATCELSKKTNNCVFLNNLDDYRLMIANYIPVMCMAMTQQEIDSVMKQFAVEWVKGSRVVNVLINSSSSKMATLLLPQFYPLTGTNHIKLIKLYGYEDKAIENFRIAENLGSLCEWVTVFTEMYNTNQIA